MELKKTVFTLFIFTIIIVYTNLASSLANITEFERSAAICMKSDLEVQIMEKIAFHSNRNGNTQIYIMNVDGSETRQLTSGEFSCTGPKISPDGSRIIYTSEVNGDYYLYIMNSDGSDRKRLTNSIGEEADPSWSSDGSFVYFRKEGSNGMSYFKSELNNATIDKIIDLPEKSRSFVISPNDNKILYTITKDGFYEIRMMNFDGTDDHRICSKKGYPMKPSWSPDGKKIAYSFSNKPPWRGGTSEIYIMMSDGSNDIKLTDKNTVSEYPGWSPDGKSIIFQSYKDGNFDLYQLEVNGGKIKQLTITDTFEGVPDWGNIKR